MEYQKFLPPLVEFWITKDAELITGDPRWYNFLSGLFRLAYSFAEVYAGGALSRYLKMA